MDKSDSPPSKANTEGKANTEAPKKKPFSMGLPPLARQPFLQPKPLREKVAMAPTAAKAGSRSKG